MAVKYCLRLNVEEYNALLIGMTNKVNSINRKGPMIPELQSFWMSLVKPPKQKLYFVDGDRSNKVYLYPVTIKDGFVYTVVVKALEEYKDLKERTGESTEEIQELINKVRNAPQALDKNIPSTECGDLSIA